MRKFLFAALAAAAVLPLQARAAGHSVEDFDLRTAESLMDLCAVPDNDPMVEAAHGFCYGFLSGVNHYHRVLNVGKKARPLYCFPEKTMLTRADAARMYVAWGRDNPQHMQEAPVDNLIRFAVATWPCKSAKR